jgi:hypothetical protein
MNSLKARVVMLAMLGLKWALEKLHDDDHRRIVKVDGGLYFLGSDAVWYVGPKGQEKISSNS